MIVAFTGHRPSKLGNEYEIGPIRTKIRAAIRAKLEELKPEKVISGMALGVDQDAAEIALELGIPFIAAIPFKGQSAVWPTSSQTSYKRLLAKAAEVKVISPGGYSSQKMLKRDAWMVDNADLLIAVWDGTSGGTGHTVHYAEGVKKTIFRINPKAL